MSGGCNDGMGYLRHEPKNPPREDVIGEMVFARHWRELMARHPRHSSLDGQYPMLEAVLNYLGEPDHRDATVAASFAVWLGSPIGSALLDHARHLPAGSQGFSPGPHAVAWLHENRRIPHVNGGYRTIELILCPSAMPHGYLGLPATVPKVHQRDLEVMEAVAAWLDTEEGAVFLRGCQTEIEAHHHQLRRQHATLAN